MEKVNVTPPEHIGCFSRSEISVKDIVTDNHNWDRYYYVHRREVRPILFKLLREPQHISFGCTSRLCLDRGKRYADHWAKRLGKALFEVPHRRAELADGPSPTDYAPG